MADIPAGVKMEPFNGEEHPTHYEWDDFYVMCLEGDFVDDDGFGEYATESHVSDRTVYPSDVVDGKRRPRWATHVVWYNQ